jgi:hypothetical protein
MGRRILTRAFLAAALLIAPAASAGASPPARLILLGLRADGIPADQQAALEGQLLARLEAAGSYRVVPPGTLAVGLGPQEMQRLAACSEVACFGELADEFEARYVLGGIVEKTGGELVVSLSLFDASTRAIVRRSTFRTATDGIASAPGIRLALVELLGLADAGRETAAPRAEAPRQAATGIDPTKPVEPATMTVRSAPPDAVVRLDGAQVGKAPVTVGLVPGPHFLDLELPGFANVRRTFEVRPGSVETLDIVLEKGRSDGELAERRIDRHLLVAAGVVAAIAGGVAAIEGYRAWSTKQELEGLVYGTNWEVNKRKDMRDYARIADISGGFCLAATSVAIYYLWKLRD